jgi:hypothetical protein
VLLISQKLSLFFTGFQKLSKFLYNNRLILPAAVFLPQLLATKIF